MEPESSEDILGPKKRNYEFLQLVRQKKYPEALILGNIILKQSPNNPSVQKFVDFIGKNAKKIDDMVKEEEEYESVHSGDDSEQDEEEVEGGQKKGDVKSESSSSDDKESEEQPMEEQKPEKKVELTTCTLNSIPHVCPRIKKWEVVIVALRIITNLNMDNLLPPECYERCNQRYSAMQPERLFCKKGCDFDENLQTCRTQNCNKLCIKEEQGDQKLWFKFLYRASGNTSICLESCIYGCHMREPEGEEGK